MNQDLAADAGRAPLGVRIDEAAEAVRRVTVPRLALYPLAALMGVLLLPAGQLLAWLGAGLGVELWTWVAGRPAAHGRPMGRLARLHFAAAFAAINLVWMALGVLFWLTGTVSGQATAMVLALSVVALGAILAHSSPMMFLLAGAAPGLAAMAMIGFRDGHRFLELAPVWVASGLGFLFLLGRARETPSAQASARQIKASARQYQLLAENVSDVIVRTDLDGAHVYVSPSVRLVLGYEPEELIGVKVADLVDPEANPVIDRAVERMDADPDRTEVITTRIRHKAGHWIWLQSHARTLFENGKPVGGIHVSRDITAQVETEKALQAAKAEAESASRAKAEFLANISHEIRTPMNGVLGALQLLEAEELSSEGRELMRRAEGAGRMLSELLNDVLDFSRIEAGQLALSPEPMSPAAALQDTLGLLGADARAKGLDLRAEIVGDPAWISADPLRLRQAMFNLLGNAIKFTAEGEVVARLEMSPESDGRRRLRLEVRDTGIGIAAENQAHLFERFRQAEGSTARRYGGSGLGLSITRALVEMMGGAIGVDSEVGRGSTFWIDLSAPDAEPVAAPSQDDGVLQGVRVLLVEDNPTNRLVARTMLTRLGAEVAEAEDGVAGVEAAREGAFALILVDVQVPRLDGVGATRAIRALDGPAAVTPVISLTANVMTHQQAAYRAAGMNGVVAKPIAVSALLGEIARILAEAEDAEALAS